MENYVNEKEGIFLSLNEEFNRWEVLLASLREEQITAPMPGSNWSIKDVIAHLMAWHQVSIARLEAARLNQEPMYPDWLAGLDPESEDEIEGFNARIYESYRQRAWSQVHRDWREGYLRLMKLGEGIPEDDLMDRSKYPWLKGYNLYAVLEGSYEHHHLDHLEPLLVWLRQHGEKETGA